MGEPAFYKKLYSTLSVSDLDSEYKEKELETISRKVIDFFQSMTNIQAKKAAKNIALIIYYYRTLTVGPIRTIPYKGKDNNEIVSLDFDLKNIPPVLARLICHYVDTI
jgi:hypothetical protein